MKLCVIPARGGSKRIPNKNIKNFNGRPIISWSIDVAIQSDCFDKVVVSTDSDKIARVSRDSGGEVPFKRPDFISDDHATTSDVMRHAIEWYRERRVDISTACCLYATAAIAKPEDIREAMQRFEQREWDYKYVFGATSFGFPIERALRIDENGKSSMINPEFFETRSQDIPAAYHDAGQFYLASAKTWLNERNIFEESWPLVIPRWRVQDIDTMEDWKRAEAIHRLCREGQMK